MEYWREVVGYEGVYEVSDAGRVRSLPRMRRVVGKGGTEALAHVRARLMRVALSKDYLVLTLSHKGTCRVCKVHRLVAAAFLGPQPPSVHVNHLNFDTTDNRLSNLEYATPRENIRHSITMGRRDYRGAGNPNAILNAVSVTEIRGRLIAGETAKTIAADNGVTSATIYRIKHGRSWTLPA